MQLGSCPECTMSTTCSCFGSVRFGYGTNWTTWRSVSGTIQCIDSVFGDPSPGHGKICQCDQPNEHCTATFAQMVGTDVATGRIDGSSDAALDAECCALCFANAECSFWVRVSGNEGPKTCWLKTNAGAQSAQMDRRGGWKQALVVNFASATPPTLPSLVQPSSRAPTVVLQRKFSAEFGMRMGINFGFVVGAVLAALVLVTMVSVGSLALSARRVSHGSMARHLFVPPRSTCRNRYAELRSVPEETELLGDDDELEDPRRALWQPME